MADFSTALWGTAQYLTTELMQMPEYKSKPSAALSIYQQNTDFLIPTSQREAAWNQKESDQNTVKIYTVNKQSTTAATARAAAHTGNNGDSTATTVTYSTKAQKFKYSMKQADKHVFTIAEMLSKQFLSAVIDLHSAIETALIANLNTNKSQIVVSSTPVGGTWDGTNYVFEVLNGNIRSYFQKIKGFMRQQYYAPAYDVLNDEFATQLAEDIVQQGQGNASNEAWQMMGLDGKTSQEISPGSGQDSIGYIIPKGTIGMLNWIPKMNRNGFGDTFKVGGSYRQVPDPLGSGLMLAVHEYATAADTDGEYGETQDIDIQVEISVDIAPVIAPMSTSNASPIFKTALLST